MIRLRGYLMTFMDSTDAIAARIAQLDGTQMMTTRAAARRGEVLVTRAGSMATMRVTREAAVASVADTQFIAHALDDLRLLLGLVRSGGVLTDADAVAVKARILGASPAPWQAFIESDGGQAGCDVIRVRGLADDEPDLYLWFDEELAPSAFFRVIAAARQDLPALLGLVGRQGSGNVVS